MKHCLGVVLIIVLVGCQQEPVTCLHIDASPIRNGELREIMHRIGERIGARVRDFSGDLPTEGNVADVFVKLEGEVNAVLAHQSMHPWVCLYGTPGSPELDRLQGLFEDELSGAGFEYSIDRRQSRN